jgi:hypothetical protein
MVLVLENRNGPMGHGLMGLVGRFGVGSDSLFYFINITSCEFGLSRKKKNPTNTNKTLLALSLI